ncbi:MAG TPA: universal stress protein [Dehalococcoidia bacterium]|nr:universal stress protein [Dehalococcoidia bacterium]
MVGKDKPGVEIVKLAAQEDCDIVVMSTHGRTGLKRAMLGSVADYVVHNIGASAVLLVRPGDVEVAGGALDSGKDRSG